MRKAPVYFFMAVAAALAAVGLTLVSANSANQAPTEASLRALLAINPHDAAAAQQLADLFSHQGRTGDAISWYQTAIRNAPDNASAPVSLALLFESQKLTAEAEHLLDANLKHHPDDPATNQAVADLAVSTLGDLAFPRVKKLYITALAGDPSRAGAALGLAKIDQATGDLSGAQSVLEQALYAGGGGWTGRGVNSRNPALHLALARVLCLRHDYAAASMHFDSGTALDPSNAQAFCDWGIMLIDADEPELAEKVLRQAIELDGKNAAYHMHLGRALRDQSRFTESSKEFKAALDADPHYAPVYLEVARSLEDVHQEPQALDYLRKALHEDPHFVDAQVALARMYSDAADDSLRNPWGAANMLLSAVDETHGQDVSLRVACAKALAAVGAFDQALGQVDAALALAPALHLSGMQREVLLQMHQDYFLATLPPIADAAPGILSVQRLNAPDDPLAEPAPKQPAVADQLPLPMEMDSTPGPGSALDPAIFLRAAGIPEGSPAPLRAGASP